MTKIPRGLNEASSEYKLEDTALQIRKIGNSVGVILPKELLARTAISRRATSSIRSSSRTAVCGFRHSIPSTRGRWKSPARSCSEYRDTFAALAK